MKTAVKPIDVVVVADTDVLDDRFWVRWQDFFGQRVAVPNANNGDFVANAIDVLVGGDDLVGLAQPRHLGAALRSGAEHPARRRCAIPGDREVLEDKLKNTQAEDQGAERLIAARRAPQPDAEPGGGDRQFPRSSCSHQAPAARRCSWPSARTSITSRAVLEFFDIAFIPILVAIAAAIIGLLRLRRRARASRTV